MNMTLDFVSKGITYLHMAIVVVMVLIGVPRIFSFAALNWGCCAWMSILLTEEEFDLELPPLWKYRILAGLGIIYTIAISFVK